MRLLIILSLSISLVMIAGCVDSTSIQEESVLQKTRQEIKRQESLFQKVLQNSNLICRTAEELDSYYAENLVQGNCSSEGFEREVKNLVNLTGTQMNLIDSMSNVSAPAWPACPNVGTSQERYRNYLKYKEEIDSVKKFATLLREHTQSLRLELNEYLAPKGIEPEGEPRIVNDQQMTVVAKAVESKTYR